MYPAYVDCDEAEAGWRQSIHRALLRPANCRRQRILVADMYDEPQSLLRRQSAHRYLINSPMLPQLKRDADGGLTLIIQKNPRARTRKRTGWPAPKGPFSMIMRLYWPKKPRWTASGSNRHCNGGPRA